MKGQGTEMGRYMRYMDDCYSHGKIALWYPDTIVCHQPACIALTIGSRVGGKSRSNLVMEQERSMQNIFTPCLGECSDLKTELENAKIISGLSVLPCSYS